VKRNTPNWDLLQAWTGTFAVSLVPRCCQVLKLFTLREKCLAQEDRACRQCSQCFLQKVLAKSVTAEFIEAREGLRASERYTSCVKAATPPPLRDFVVDLRERLHAMHRSAVQRELNGADPRTHAHKLASYHAWMAFPLKPSTA